VESFSPGLAGCKGERQPCLKHIKKSTGENGRGLYDQRKDNLGSWLSRHSFGPGVGICGTCFKKD